MAYYYDYPSFIREWEPEFLNLLVEVGIANYWRTSNIDLVKMKLNIDMWMQKNKFKKGELFFDRLNAYSKPDQKSLLEFIADIINGCGRNNSTAKEILRVRIQEIKSKGFLEFG